MSRRALISIVFAAVLQLVPVGSAGADGGCGNDNWSDDTWMAQSGDSGLGGTGATGDDSGLGGTGATGDSGLGGTGIFGVITDLGSICVNGAWVHFAGDVEVVFENGVAIGEASLVVGQTVWLVAQEGDEGLETDRIWVLPSELTPRAASTWLDARIRDAGALERISLEGPVSRIDSSRIEVRGVPVDAPNRSDLRGHIDRGSSVRVDGRVGRDGIIRAERIQVPTRPPPRPERPVVRPPKIERPPNRDLPKPTTPTDRP